VCGQATERKRQLDAAESSRRWKLREQLIAAAAAIATGATKAVAA
jgi:hypothetical protein